MLIDKTAKSASPYTVFIKIGDDTKVNIQQLDKLIDMLTKQPGSLNPNETWDILLLFDKTIPVQALCLLQPSLVTFVTYRMHGKTFELNDPNGFKFENAYSTFVKELLSSNLDKKHSISQVSNKKSNLVKKQSISEVSNKTVANKKVFIAFIGVFTETRSEESHAKEVEIVNKNLCILERNINCSLQEIPLLLWYLEDDNDHLEKDSQDQYLHLVNLADHKDKNFGLIKTKFEDIVFDNSTHKNVSLSWILLYLKIQKICSESKNSFLEYSTVLELWIKEFVRSEDELHHALKFFHDMGALFYFESVYGIRNFVFTDLCWLFKRLDCLYRFKENAIRRCDSLAKYVLKYDGILTYRMMEEIKPRESETMKLQHFIKLLEHLKFVAPIKQNGYFFPSILDSYHNGDVSLNGKPQFEPLLITFSTGSLYRNVFCFLAANVIKNLPLGWSRLMYDKNERHQYTYRDLIIFDVDIDHRVCIFDKTFFLEIQIYNRCDDCSAYPHNNVFKTIKGCLTEVSADLNLPPDDFKYGFSCCFCKSEREQNVHLMVIKNPDENTKAYCSKTDGQNKLQEQHTVWFSEVKNYCNAC